MQIALSEKNGLHKRMVLHEGASSKRIDVIFDVYRENSINNTEREHRGAEYGNEFRNFQPDHMVQQWRKFLPTESTE